MQNVINPPRMCLITMNGLVLCVRVCVLAFYVDTQSENYYLPAIEISVKFCIQPTDPKRRLEEALAICALVGNLCFKLADCICTSVRASIAGGHTARLLDPFLQHEPLQNKMI